MLVQIRWRNQKLYRRAKAKIIQHHKTSFTTNTKGTSLGRKEKGTPGNKKIMNGKATRKGKRTVKLGNHSHTYI